MQALTALPVQALTTLPVQASALPSVQASAVPAVQPSALPAVQASAMLTLIAWPKQERLWVQQRRRKAYQPCGAAAISPVSRFACTIVIHAPAAVPSA